VGEPGAGVGHGEPRRGGEQAHGPVDPGVDRREDVGAVGAGVCQPRRHVRGQGGEVVGRVGIGDHRGQFVERSGQSPGVGDDGLGVAGRRLVGECDVGRGERPGLQQ
jgi:hypothetical protein